jgi:YegS/Rv2252/BmrU family lipid kinase
MEHIIVNPVAGRGAAQGASERLAQWFGEKNIPHAMHHTQREGHAREIAKGLAASGEACVWALGGDATLREVAQGLHGTGAAMGVLPCGTGNDLCRVLGVPARDPINAYERQQGGVRALDLWMINDDIFLNVAGIGLDVETLVQTRKFRRMPGSMGPYMMGLLTAILTHKNGSFTVEIDGKAYDGGFLMLAMANGRYFGGGMCVAPNADPADGLLDVVMIGPTPRARIPFLLPKLLKATHINLDITRVVRGKELIIRSDTDAVFQADGELYPFRTLHVRPSEHKLLLRALTPTRAEDAT